MSPPTGHLDQTTLEATTDGNGDSSDLPRGTTVRYFGDYEIQKELGRGGMGVVYKALQVSLNRPVALKMIKAGVLADDAELQRFQNEAEAVALLDHPGIVPVYEVGDHEGQRYFSMKLVEGGNLAEQLASFKDNPRAAATLLAETAEAVHHAHMRGILHRDLKPANILIDAEGHPHVTDFGLAKRVEGDVEMTVSGAILGTPAYMSPEQAIGRRGSITTATDVYGLGAILYALLTGKAPFGGESVIDTLDAVRHHSPEPPRKFNGSVPHDLETICLKCLDKDPRKRYATAHELGVDLNNWLDSRPITARRVGAAEQAWLWCKRKPAVAGLAAAVLLAVVGGTAGIFAVQARANADLRMSNGKLDEANTELLSTNSKLDRTNAELRTSNTLLDQQRARAEDRETQAIAAVKKFADVITNDSELKNNKALENLRKRLLNEPLAFFRTLRERLQADRDTRPESLARLADASFDLGFLTDEIGDKQDALIAYRESLAIRQKLADANPSVTKFQSGLGSSFTTSIGILRGPPASRAEGALESSRVGRLAIQQKLADANPSVSEFQSDLANSHNSIGILLEATGKPAEAMEAHQSALAIRRKLADANPSVSEFQSDLALSHNNIGILLKKTGKPAEALKAYEASLAIGQKLADANPTVNEFQGYLAYSHNNLGILLSDTGKPTEALKAYESALAIQQKLADANPSVTLFQSDLAASHNNIGNLLNATGRPAEALTCHELALAIRRKLADDNPSVAQFQSDLARSYNDIGIQLSDTGRPAEALTCRELALAIWRKLADANPAVTQFQRDLADSHNEIGDLLSATGKPAEALKSHESALAIQSRLARDYPDLSDFASGLGTTLNDMATIDLDAKRYEDALVRLRQAVEWQRKALASDPTNPTYRQFLADHWTNLVRAAQGLGDSEGVAEAQRELAQPAAIRTQRWRPSTRDCPRSSEAINSQETTSNGSSLPRGPTTRRSTPPRRSSGPRPSTPTRNWPRIARPGIATTPPAPPRWPGAARGRTTRPPTTRRRRNSASRLADGSRPSWPPGRSSSNRDRRKSDRSSSRPSSTGGKTRTSPASVSRWALDDAARGRA